MRVESDVLTVKNSPVRTLCEAFQMNVAQYAERIALRAFDTDEQFTWSEYGERGGSSD
ncbi:hypothetical protein [Mycobacterium vicinigordonae]|uniref:Uncharacterized protein n=1 Tax=Mycobacterium vicinigordonae TaxID=1719132 RepID=A0A7D6IB40_9MYCO|nr:hypothetical protein [Mycobacterium vicinigordonae]QLL09297.1 hypothetical protein H0P51_10665 [Mycobacterium vicinigordonae]